jgi:hypothetical protein
MVLDVALFFRNKIAPKLLAPWFDLPKNYEQNITIMKILIM